MPPTSTRTSVARLACGRAGAGEQVHGKSCDKRHAHPQIGEAGKLGGEITANGKQRCHSEDRDQVASAARHDLRLG